MCSDQHSVKEELRSLPVIKLAGYNSMQVGCGLRGIIFGGYVAQKALGHKVSLILKCMLAQNPNCLHANESPKLAEHEVYQFKNVSVSKVQ